MEFDKTVETAQLKENHYELHMSIEILYHVVPAALIGVNTNPDMIWILLLKFLHRAHPILNPSLKYASDNLVDIISELYAFFQDGQHSYACSFPPFESITRCITHGSFVN